MNTKDTVVLYMSVAGFLIGLYNLWRADRDSRQRIQVTASDTQKDWFKVTNHSARPIPIQSVTLFGRRGHSKFASMGNAEIRNLKIPGSLAPESSFEVSWSSLEQIVGTMFQDEYYVELKTQTGKKIKSRKVRQH